MLETAVVIQCFIKSDTLSNLFTSLLNCDGLDRVHLIVWADSPVGAKAETSYTEAAAGVRELVREFLRRDGDRFRSTTMMENTRNQGTCATCRKAVDFALSLHPFAILIEDDAILGRDTLLWFDAMRQQCLEPREDVWAIAGESLLFDSRAKPLPTEWLEKMRQKIVDDNLVYRYTELNFIPSTCFATTSERWTQWGETRGRPNGDRDVCIRCRAEKKVCIFPIVPRVKDVGMLHHLGYSVRLHTKAGVAVPKTTYLTCDDFERAAADYTFAPYAGPIGPLFASSVLLQGSGHREDDNATQSGLENFHLAEISCQFPSNPLPGTETRDSPLAAKALPVAEVRNWWKHEFYSQFGEDSIVFSYFRRKGFARSGRLDDIGPGFYVDIGCHHPTIISNTWFFYQKGWRGINVDPTPGVKEDFDEIRPLDINIQAAVSSTDGSATFYSYGRTVHNTMDASRVIKGKTPEALTVESMKLSTLLKNHLPEGEAITLLSVDVEGTDLEVLQSNDWVRFRPEMIIVEHHDGRINQVISSEIFQYTLSQGYELFGWSQPSLVFRRR